MVTFLRILFCFAAAQGAAAMIELALAHALPALARRTADLPYLGTRLRGGTEIPLSLLPATTLFIVAEDPSAPVTLRTHAPQPHSLAHFATLSHPPAGPTRVVVIVSGAAGVSLSALWFLTADLDWSWVLQDALGVAFVLHVRLMPACKHA